MARDGLSNPEVGSRLFISPRTVEWYLRKVFVKLDIGSRKELRAALSGAEYEFDQANRPTAPSCSSLRAASHPDARPRAWRRAARAETTDGERAAMIWGTGDHIGGAPCR